MKSSVGILNKFLGTEPTINGTFCEHPGGIRHSSAITIEFLDFFSSKEPHIQSCLSSHFQVIFARHLIHCSKLENE
jgi:hypothetical protein